MAFLPFPVLGRALRRGLGMSGGGGVRYLLLDQFNTPRAAGAVNGTPAEPTGQLRTATDGNLKLSIAGGLLNLATGGVGAGDPGIWYPAITRALGLTLLSGVVPSVNACEIGWDATAVGAITTCIRANTNGLGVRDNATVIVVGANLVAATSYTVAVVLRSTGAWMFIKGGTFTTWTLVWVSALVTGNLLPSISATNAADVWTADNIRIPTATYIPTPLAYDTFTRANGALGSTETVGPDAQVLAALAWAFTVGIWTISTNKAINTPVLGAELIINGNFAAGTDWTLNAGWAIGAGTLNGIVASTDTIAVVPPLTIGRWYRAVYTVSAFAAGTVQLVAGGISLPTHAANGTYTETFRSTSTGFRIRGVGFTGSVDDVSCKELTLAELFATVPCSSADVIIDKAITLSAATNVQPDGIVVNLDSTSSPANFIVAYLDGQGNCNLDECVAGVYANKISAVITYSAGAVLRVIRDGTSCRIFYNNAAVGTVQTMTANVNKNHGMYGTNPINSSDNATIWPRGTSGEYAGLDAFNA